MIFSNLVITLSCPLCGGPVPVTDLQTVKRGGFTATGSSRVVAGELLQLAEEMGSLSAQEAADLLEQRAPWLAPVAAWLRENSSYAGWLGLVLTIILHFTPSPLDDGQPAQPSPTRVEETLQQILEELRSTPASTTPEQPGTSPPLAPPPPGPIGTSSPPGSDSPPPPAPPR